MKHWREQTGALVRHVREALDNANHARCMSDYVHDYYGLPVPTWREEAWAWIAGFYVGLKGRDGTASTESLVDNDR